MKETASNGCQILSDGRTVWVNGLSGESLARLSSFRGMAIIDIHNKLDAQRQTGSECLDCRHDLKGANAYEYFVLSLKRNFGVEVAEEHRPQWASST